MPPCFEKWCQCFDDCFSTKAQKTGFRNYLVGLLGESERKNLTRMANNAVGVVYNRLHHFLTEAPWEATNINERRLPVMNKCSQTRISRGFSLIVDDSGHRKSGATPRRRTDGAYKVRNLRPHIAPPQGNAHQDRGNFRSGVGRQYIGEIGKTDNGIVAVTTHLYDGKTSLPLNIELYQHASSLREGKQDEELVV